MNSFIWRKKNINGGSGGSVDTSNLVTLNTNQNITGDKEFSGNTQFNKVVEFHNGTDNDCSLAIHRDNTHANYVGFYNGNVRLGYIGKNSSNDTNFTIGSDTGNIKFLAHNNIDCNNKLLFNVLSPTNNNDAANKQYVDNKFGYSSLFSKNDINTNGYTNAWVHWTITQNNSISTGYNKFILKIVQNNISYTKPFGLYVSNVSDKNASEIMSFKVVDSSGNNIGSNDNQNNLIEVALCWTNANTIILNLKTTQAIASNFTISCYKNNFKESVS